MVLRTKMGRKRDTKMCAVVLGSEMGLLRMVYSSCQHDFQVGFPQPIGKMSVTKDNEISHRKLGEITYYSSVYCQALK